MIAHTRTRDGAHHLQYLVAGEPVSHLYVRDFQMRIGAAVLRMGGIADVETKQEYRRRGFARQLLDRAMELMRREGYHISALFGISDFYPRWGYAPIFPETRLLLAAADAARCEQHYALRRLKRRELAATLELYQRNNAARTGPIVRRPGRWAGFRQGSRWKRRVNVYGAFDRGGRLMGYAVLDRSPAEAVIAEIGYRREEVFGTLLAAAVRHARRVNAEQVVALVPADHPFVEYCQRLGCRLMVQYHRSGGAMGRIINLEGCLRRLAPELTQRLRASRLQWAGPLRIATDIGAVTLRVSPQAVRVSSARGAQPEAQRAGPLLEIGQAMLTQLLFGYRSAGDVLRSAGDVLRSADARLTGAPLQLLDALFPRRWGWVWHPDYF